MRLVRLRELARIRRGASPRPIADPRWFAPAGPGWVRISDVTRSGKYLTSTQQALSSDGVARSVRVSNGDVLISVAASVGVTAIVAMDACIHDGWVVLSEFEERLDREFLYYLLSFESSRIASVGQHGAQSNINSDILGDWKVRVPSMAAQRTIAGVLRTCDEVIDRLDGVITAKRTFKRALMQDLLTGRRRFGGGGSRSWSIRKLGEVTAINPESLGEAADPKTLIRYIELSAIEGGILRIPHAAIPFGESPSRARRVVRNGDVLFSTVRPYLQGFAIVDNDADDLVCSTGFAVLRTERIVDARFLLEVLFSDGVSRQTTARLTGSSYPALNEGDVAGLRVPWPDRDERESITRALWAARLEINTLEELRAAYATLKRGLMQKLLSGEITIPDRIGTPD